MSPLESYFLEHPEAKALADYLVWLAFGLAAWASSLLLLAIAPGRHEAAVEALYERPWRCLLLGAPFMLPTFALFLWLVAQEIAQGSLTVIILLLIACTIGLSICGRGLGERLLPQRGATAATALGAGLTVCTMPLVPLGLALLVLFACLGIGAWLCPEDGER